MTVWDELKRVLARLRDEQPGTLTSYPMPEVNRDRKPPFRIHLAPWATATAEQLHQQFGGDVDLTVGALPYPPGRQPRPAPAAGQVTAKVIDPGTGQVVGGYSGARRLPLVVFRVAPGHSGQIPLLIGTASTAPRRRTRSCP
jgi:hypothetical protein